MSVKNNRLTQPIYDSFDVFGKFNRIHKPALAGAPVVPRTVQNRCKAPSGKNPGSGNHAIPIAAPSMRQDNQTS